MSSDDQKEGAEETAAEKDQSRSIESVLAESNRKFSKIAEENQRLSQQLEQLTSLVSKSVQKPEPSNSVKDDDSALADLAYSNPAEYAKRITERATRQATQVVQQTIQQQQQTNTVLTQLAADYPELSDNNSELTTKAVSIYKNMTESERNSPMSYKIAVRDAAADLGILPKAKRANNSNAEPNVGSGSSAANAMAKSTPKKTEGKAGEATLEFARLMGLDVSDKKVVERLNKRSERKNWGRYE